MSNNELAKALRLSTDVLNQAMSDNKEVVNAIINAMREAADRLEEKPESADEQAG